MEANNDDDNNNNEVIGAQPACAACKHRRRKCPPDCLLAPYFPADKKDEFESVMKTCSLESLKEMIKNVEAPEDRHRVAEAVTWVAGCWEEDPVLGPAGKYLRSLQQAEELKRERAALREMLRGESSSPSSYVQQHSPDGSQYSLPDPLNGDDSDDTQSEDSP